MIVEALRQLAACYLIVTLVATSLAKLRRWRASSIALAREAVFPASIAPHVIIGVALAEFALATLLMLRAAPVETGCATAVLFVLFGGYRLVAVTRSKSLGCPCAGVARIGRATPQGVAAAAAASVFQAGMACAWAFGGSADGLDLVGVIAWLAPFAVLLTGYLLPGQRWSAPRSTGERAAGM